MARRPPVDLPRVRRALAGLDALALAHPELIDHGATGPANRAAWEATLRTEELNVSNDPTRAAPAWISVSIPADLVDRAAALVPILADLPELRAGGVVNRATVVRLALLYGLDRVEADHGPAGGSGAR